VAGSLSGVAEGVNVDGGRVTNQAVAATFGLPYSPWNPLVSNSSNG
jgi:alanine dehydrogenase